MWSIDTGLDCKRCGKPVAFGLGHMYREETRDRIIEKISQDGRCIECRLIADRLYPDHNKLHCGVETGRQRRKHRIARRGRWFCKICGKEKLRGKFPVYNPPRGMWWDSDERGSWPQPFCRDCLDKRTDEVIAKFGLKRVSRWMTPAQKEKYPNET